MYNSNGFRDCR